MFEFISAILGICFLMLAVALFYYGATRGAADSKATIKFVVAPAFIVLGTLIFLYSVFR